MHKIQSKTSQHNPTNSQSYEEKAEENRYNNEREKLGELETNQSNLFDKYLLTLSASFLALSLSIYSKFAEKQILWKELIVAFLFLFMSSVFCVLLSLYFSTLCCGAYRDQLDKHYKNTGQVTDQYKSTLSIIIPILNIISITSFIMGTLSLIFFTIKNI